MSLHILTPDEAKRRRNVLLSYFAIRPDIQRMVAELATSHEQLDHKYRRALWFQHGCPVACLYGDDGEMQCASEIKDGFRRHLPLDFKRDTILHLEEEIGKAKLTESGVIFKGLNDEPVKA